MTKTNQFSKEYIFIIIAMCGLSAGAVGSLVNASGVFFSPMATDLGIGRGSVALTLTIVSITAAIIGIFVPKIFNEKRWRFIVTIGSLAMVGSTIGLAFVNSLKMIYFLSVIRGLGAGLLQFVTITMFINNWFYAKHGLITSLTMCFSGVAGAALSPILSSVIANYGWRIGYIVVGIIMLVCCLPSILLPISLSPESKGLKAYGIQLKKETAVVTEEHSSNSFATSFILLCAISIFVNVSVAVAQHLPAYANELGYSTEVGAFMLSLALIGNITSKLAVGSLTDLVGTKNALVIITVIDILSFILLLLNINLLFTQIGSLLFGCSYGIAAVGVTLVTKSLFGNKGFVKVYPLVSFIGASSNAVAASAIGYLYDWTNSYILAIQISIVLMILVLFFIILAFRKKKEA